jgi:predicted Zn-ribbon and HTH transcriptional regulator
MAEFCRKHARELGMRLESYPLFCETCGYYHQGLMRKIINKIKYALK